MHWSLFAGEFDPLEASKLPIKGETSPLNTLWWAWILSELVVLLFNRQRRALHDFLGGTVVVHVASVAASGAGDRNRGRLRLVAITAAGIVAFLVVVGGAVGWALFGKSGLMHGMATESLDKLAVELEAFHDEHGKYPKTLEELGLPLSEIFDVTQAFSTTGSAGNFYYRRSNRGQRYDLLGVGADGTPFTEDDLLPSGLSPQTKAGRLLDRQIMEWSRRLVEVGSGFGSALHPFTQGEAGNRAALRLAHATMAAELEIKEVGMRGGAVSQEVGPRDYLDEYGGFLAPQKEFMTGP